MNTFIIDLCCARFIYCATLLRAFSFCEAFLDKEATWSSKRKLLLRQIPSSFWFELLLYTYSDIASCIYKQGYNYTFFFVMHSLLMHYSPPILHSNHRIHESIFNQCSTSIPPENIRKPEVF